jgi:hypothetical protein
MQEKLALRNSNSFVQREILTIAISTKRAEFRVCGVDFVAQESESAANLLDCTLGDSN